MSLRNTDKILVHREGSDYQADMRPLIPQKWTPPTAYTVESENVFPGMSDCFAGYPEAHRIATNVPPAHVQLPDLSHNYIVTVVCGGPNAEREPCYFLMLDNELNITKTIQPPVVGQKCIGGRLQSFPNSSPRAGVINNILVWNHPDGIWCSEDYGDTWTKYENAYGATGDLTADNCKLYFSFKYYEVMRTSVVFNKIPDPKDLDRWCYDKVTISTRNFSSNSPNFEIEYLYQNDIDLRPGHVPGFYDRTSELSYPEGKLLLSMHLDVPRTQFVGGLASSSWGDFEQPDGGYMISCGTQESNDAADGFPVLTIVHAMRDGLRGVETFEGDILKNWWDSIPPEVIKYDRTINVEEWAIAWDPAQKAFLCYYTDSDYIFDWSKGGGGLSPGAKFGVFQIIATRNFQTGWIPYNGGVLYKGAELVYPTNTQSTGADSGGISPSNYLREQVGGLVMRFPGSTTGFFFAGEDIWTLDSPVNGQMDYWSFMVLESCYVNWAVPLADGRLWGGQEVTVQPFYSLKPGLVLDGHFIETPALEVGSPLTLPFDYKSVPLDISTLPPLA
jgi:hypothetical protein